jgi:hypothetical protein
MPVGIVLRTSGRVLRRLLVHCRWWQWRCRMRGKFGACPYVRTVRGQHSVGMSLRWRGDTYVLNQPFQVGDASLESLDIAVKNVSPDSDAICPSRCLRSHFGGRLARRRSISVPRATFQRGVIVGALYRVGDTSCATATRYIGTITWREIVNGRRPLAFNATYIELGGSFSLGQG